MQTRIRRKFHRELPVECRTTTIPCRPNLSAAHRHQWLNRSVAGGQSGVSLIQVRRQRLGLHPRDPERSGTDGNQLEVGLF